MQAVQLELELDLEQPGLGLTTAAPHPGTPEGLVIDQNRVYFLEILYQADGRDNPDHPFKGTYTGLAEAFYQQLGRSLVEQAIQAPDMRAVLDLFKLGASGS
jgi:hypothetical protein